MSEGNPSAGAPYLAQELTSLWDRLREVGMLTGSVEGVRPTMRLLAQAAHADEMLPERLLWVLKESWRDLPEVKRERNRSMTDGRREIIVTLCIEEYYNVLDSRRR